VAGFVNAFVDAFGTFSGARVAALYPAPSVALRGDGSIAHVPTREEIARFFQAALDGYHRDGCRTARFKGLDVVPMGSRSALGRVTWELLGGDGRIVRQWRQSYNLVRIEQSWQVFASTAHLP
jgi:hypothetical protein